MNKRKKSANPWRIIILSVLVASAVYINQVIVPITPPLFIATTTPTRPPESYIADAERLVEEGRYALAIESYQQVIQIDPRNPTHYLEIARLMIYIGRYEEAAVQAANALLLSPNNALSYIYQGWANGFMGLYTDAEGAINRAIELEPSNALAYAVRSLILSNEYQDGSGGLTTRDDAIEDSRTARDMAPNMLESHWARGVVLEITGNYGEAVTEIQAAINLNSNIAELHLALGRNLRFTGDAAGAIEEFNRANALNPGDPLPDTYISRTYAANGEYAKAIQFAEQAVRDAPDDAYMYGNLGVMYFRNRQYEDAIASLTLAVRGGLNPESLPVDGIPLDYGRVAEYFYSYGLSLARLGYCGEALPIAQALQVSVRDDEDAIYNAQEIITTCQQFADFWSCNPNTLKLADACRNNNTAWDTIADFYIYSLV